MHTSPLAQPGTGDGGGMNVYVRELVSSLAQAGVRSVVFVRRWRDDLPDVIDVEPNFRVVHIDAGPPDLAKEQLVDTVDEFTDNVARHLHAVGDIDALHANYWLSGLAGHRLKHEFGLPLVSTFHTLARVKADAGDEGEPQRRLDAEAEIIGCSDAILAACAAEADWLDELCGAPRDRIEIVPPGVDHAFFSPGDRGGARQALGLDGRPVILFAGRIQPLKGVDVAIDALARMRRDDSVLLVVGGASGVQGTAEVERVHKQVADLGLAERVRFVPPQPHHLLSTYYRAADVTVVPSRTESFGLVALESAACGTPVVAAAVGGLRTLVDHGRTGYLVDERDAARYAAHLDALVDDPAHAAELGRAAAQLARSYTWSTTAGRLRRIYGDLTVRAPVTCA